MVSVDGRTATRLTDHPAEDRDPVWSPDGRHVAFISSRFGNDALWVVPVKDGQPAGDPLQIKDGMQDATLKDWTPKGLAYSQLTRTSDIYTVSLDPATGQPTAQPQQLPYGRTGRNSGPVWSPDGRQLAFVAGSPAEPNRRYIVVLPDKGGEPREFLIPTTRFAPGGLDPFDLRWFGDGSGLGFSGFNAEGQRSVFQLSLASGQWKVIPSPSTRQTFVEWDQNGRRVFYTQESVSIVERELGTDRDRLITRIPDTSSAVRGLRLSPDRRSLAFIVRPGADSQDLSRLMVVDLQSGQARTLLEEKSDGLLRLGVPAWSPDGRVILLTRTVGNGWPELRLVPFDGGAARSMVLDRSFARSARGTDNVGPAVGDVVWSPDGAGLVFALLANRPAASIIESVLPATASAARTAR
jgi:Tol biopolymer transport system component